MTTLNVKRKWSFQTGGLSRLVQFARNPMVNRIFTNWKMVFPDSVVVPEGVVPDRFHCIQCITTLLFGQFTADLCELWID